jgi:hypothetical protein
LFGKGSLHKPILSVLSELIEDIRFHCDIQLVLNSPIIGYSDHSQAFQQADIQRITYIHSSQGRSPLLL